MSANSSIEWTESTWNPITGCTKISSGCLNCYAERMARRLKAMGQPNYVNGFDLAIHKDTFDLPLKWKQSRTIFVNSMSDMFHENIPGEVIRELIEIMRRAFWHRFQILTKRAERLFSIGKDVDWPENVWMGVTIESKREKQRMEYLKRIGAKVKFLSIEPLLSQISDLNLKGIDWVILGGESGPGARPMNPEWVIEIRNQCLEQNVPFFFKQWGGKNKKKNGRLLEGRVWSEKPVVTV